MWILIDTIAIFAHLSIYTQSVITKSKVYLEILTNLLKNQKLTLYVTDQPFHPTLYQKVNKRIFQSDEFKAIERNFFQILF